MRVEGSVPESFWGVGLSVSDTKVSDSVMESRRVDGSSQPARQPDGERPDRHEQPVKRVKRIDEEWLGTCRPAKRQEWGVRQHPGLRVRVGPREASFYYYSTEFDSRGKPKRKGYNLGTFPELSLEVAAEQMRRLRKAGPAGRLAERWTVRRVLEDLANEKLSAQRKGFEVAASIRTHALEARPVKGGAPFGDWKVSQVEKAHLVELVRAARTQTREKSRRWGGPDASRALAKAFRVLFAQAEEVGAVDRNVAASLVAGAPLPRNDWLSTKEQLAAFFGAVDLRALLAGERAPSSLSAVVRLSLAFLAVVPVRKESFRLRGGPRSTSRSGRGPCRPSARRRRARSTGPASHRSWWSSRLPRSPS